MSRRHCIQVTLAPLTAAAAPLPSEAASTTPMRKPAHPNTRGHHLAELFALAEVGVPMLCYNWMAGLSWYRTRVDVPARGGALLSEFDNEAAKRQGPTEWGEVSEEKIWSNLEYFLKAVIPVAEQAGVKMAL